MKPEAREAAALLDRLPEPTRVYLLGMLYRMTGVVPPPRRQREPENVAPATGASENVIQFPGPRP